MVVGLTMSLPEITYDELCLVTNAPHTLIIYAYAISFYFLHSHVLTYDHDASRAAAIVFQAMLFTVTIYKFILAVRDGWGDVALIVLLIRDGTWAFCLLFCASSFYRNSIWVIYRIFCFVFIQSVMRDTLCCMHYKMVLMRVSYMGECFFLGVVPLLIILLDGFWLYSHFV